MKKIIFIFLMMPQLVLAYAANYKPLPRNPGLNEEYLQQRFPISANRPIGTIHSLGEWEDSDSVMTLWNNRSLIDSLSRHGRVTILADGESALGRWKFWLQRNEISQRNISYYTIPTNSLWVRDYGPLFILDGRGDMGVVDTVYNRPRPLDDQVPQYIGRNLGLPVYQPGVVHTGGNFYSDGVGNGFSSTLVKTENPLLSFSEIEKRMLEFLGVKRYTTARLAPKITIEHIDTFGKLVAPDTWVVGRFPKNTPYFNDSENFVKKLHYLKSPYGTPYKIFRLPLPESRGDRYPAYINSLIHNDTLFFAAYGTRHDRVAQEVYQKALPGYKIVPVDAQETFWGDSVHCRTRNIHSRRALFVFPKVVSSGAEKSIVARVIPSPGARLLDGPKVNFVSGDRRWSQVMEPAGRDTFVLSIPSSLKGPFSFFIEAQDSNGFRKTAPRQAPAMLIDVSN